MKAPERMRARYRRDPENELRLIQRRFRAIRHRHDRAIKLRRLFHRACLPMMAVIAIVMLCLGLTSAFPWLPTMAREYFIHFVD